MGGNGFKLLAPIHRIVRFYEQMNISKKGKISTCKKQFDINKRLSCTLPASKCVINLKASIFRTATRRKPLWVPQGSSAIRKFIINSVMIQKKKINPFTHTGKCWYYDEPPYLGHFYNKRRFLRWHVAAPTCFV